MQQQLARCLHTEASLLGHQPAEADSPDFVGPRQTKISNSVTYEPSIAVAKKWFAAYSSPRTPSCLKSAMAGAIKQALRAGTKAGEAAKSAGAAIGQAKIAQLSFPRAGDETAAFQVSVPISLKRLILIYYLDLIALRKGRAVAGVSIQSSIKATDVATAQKLTTLTASRMTNTG